MAEWEKEIALGDVPEDFRALADKVGLESLLAVMRHFAGDKVYFPKMDGAFKRVRDRVIHREWKRCRDPRAIGQKYDLTVEQVRGIVGEHEDQLALLPR